MDGLAAARIELAENGEAVAADLDPATAAALADSELVEVRPSGGVGWTLVPRPNRVGAVRVGHLDVVVLPKASFASVVFMLGYARDPGFRPDQFDGTAADDLWPMVAETLARLAERALLRGVIQGYVTRDESLPLVRGRIRTADQMSRHHGLPLPLEVTFEEYDVDIPENRMLRTALTRMGRVPRLPQNLRRRLQHLAARLDAASVIAAGAPLPNWRPTRLNAVYQPALRLAELVLRRFGLTTTAGTQPVASFVVDMAAVFEDFVTTAMRESLLHTSPGVTTGQFRDHLDREHRVPIRPDIVHSIAGVPAAVFDAKYKLASESDGYPTADVYQMLAYCTALQLRSGYLVYAGSRAKGALPRGHGIRNTDVSITTWPLDVTSSPGDLLDQVREVGRVAVDSPVRLQV